MSCISSNCRGEGKLEKVRLLVDLVRDSKSEFVFLVETFRDDSVGHKGRMGVLQK